ncbi:MAG: serine/threonine-protein kinase, partial [Planctomycetota bacterium]
MAPPSYERVKDVFLAACRLPMPQRASFLGQACAGDEALHSEVAVLLEHDSALAGLGDVPLSGQAGFVGVRRPQPVMEASSLVDPRSATGSPHIPSPERVGRYRILGVLGCGGMAVVYRAEQDRPRREVALKLIRPGIPTHQLLRRFEHEAQVLGRLHHPGIAQIFEAGCADSPEGPQPFFAMELIDGQPLTSYADENRLAPRERLSLLAQVCDAVQAAHQKGVIHRDLKPSNILVDRAGQPRILDFGVARTTDADVLLATLHTEVGAVVGTLPYMSPEQAAGDPHELDTRA